MSEMTNACIALCLSPNVNFKSNNILSTNVIGQFNACDDIKSDHTRKRLYDPSDYKGMYSESFQSFAPEITIGENLIQIINFWSFEIHDCNIQS